MTTSCFNMTNGVKMKSIRANDIIYMTQEPSSAAVQLKSSTDQSINVKPGPKRYASQLKTFQESNQTNEYEMPLEEFEKSIGEC